MDKKLFCVIKVISLLSLSMWNMESTLASNPPGEHTLILFNSHLPTGTKEGIFSLQHYFHFLMLIIFWIHFPIDLCRFMLFSFPMRR